MLSIVTDDADVWSPVGAKTWNWQLSRRASLRFTRMVRQGRKKWGRHRQRCANLNLQYPLAHPYGWPDELPIDAPLPRPWKIAR